MTYRFIIGLFSLFIVLNYVQHLLYAHLALYPELRLDKMPDALFDFSEISELPHHQKESHLLLLS